MEGSTKSQTKVARDTTPPTAPPPMVKWNHEYSKDKGYMILGVDVAVSDDMVVTCRLTPRGMEIKAIIDKLK